MTVLRGVALVALLLWMVWISVMLIAAQRNSMWACLYASQAAFGNTNLASRQCKEGLLPAYMRN